MKPADGLSFQLYSARLSGLSLEDQFAMLAGLGYRNVEPFGGLLAEADLLQGLLAKHNMRAPTCHVGLDRMRGDLAGTVALCKSLGIEIVLAPAPPPGERDGGEKEWQAMGRELAAHGKAFNAAGMAFGWHNHHWEFGKAADGRTFLDVMFAEAPDIVWQADMAWIIRGNADPVAAMNKYAKRLVAAHVKDLAPAGQCLDEDGWADPGHGTMDWPALRAALSAAGVKHYVVEHDKPNDAARFARRAAETVSSWL